MRGNRAFNHSLVHFPVFEVTQTMGVEVALFGRSNLKSMWSSRHDNSQISTSGVLRYSSTPIRNGSGGKVTTRRCPPNMEPLRRSIDTVRGGPPSLERGGGKSRQYLAELASGVNGSSRIKSRERGEGGGEEGRVTGRDGGEIRSRTIPTTTPRIPTSITSHSTNHHQRECTSNNKINKNCNNNFVSPKINGVRKDQKAAEANRASPEVVVLISRSPSPQESIEKPKRSADGTVPEQQSINVPKNIVSLVKQEPRGERRAGCDEGVSRRRQLMAGGSVLMDLGTEEEEDEGEEKGVCKINGGDINGVAIHGLAGVAAVTACGEELEFAELEEHVWLLLWLVLGPQRLQCLCKRDVYLRTLSWERGGARLVWRALQLCCSAQGTKSASAIPLAEEHFCDLSCLRDHASRMLEVCAPTRELWRSFGWAGLTVDAVLHKILREDVLPHVALLPSVPPEVSASLRRIEAFQAALRQLSVARNFAASAVNSEDENRGSGELRVADVESSAGPHVRRKRGRPAKTPEGGRREPGRLERVFLWRFLLDLLEDPRLGTCLRWVQRDEGIFRILNTDMLARLWGRRHGNPRMTYEKMARAMRTYYRSRVLLPVPRIHNLPRKLVYRFSPTVLQKVLAEEPRGQVRAGFMLQATRIHSSGPPSLSPEQMFLTSGAR